MTSVLIADDHAMVRDGLKAVLEAAGDMRVIATVADGREAVDTAKRRHPDVAVMDVAMPVMDGIQAAREMHRACPAVRIIMLSMHSALAYVSESVRAGALGYVLKESAGAELVAAVRSTMGGRMFFSRRVAEGMTGWPGGEGPAGGSLDRLSEREREVIRLVAEGSSSKAVAVRLGISAKTVDTYRSRAMSKLGVDNLAGLVRAAIQSGLIVDTGPGEAGGAK